MNTLGPVAGSLNRRLSFGQEMLASCRSGVFSGRSASKGTNVVRRPEAHPESGTESQNHAGKGIGPA